MKLERNVLISALLKTERGIFMKMSAPEQIQNLIEATTMATSETFTVMGSNEQNNNDTRGCSTETSLDPTFAAMRRRRDHGSSKTSSRSSSSSSARKRKRRRSSTESSLHTNVTKIALSPFTPMSGNENKGNCSPSSCSSGSGSSSSDNGGSSSEGEEEDPLFEQEQSSQLQSSSQCSTLSIEKGPLSLAAVNGPGTYSSDESNNEGSYSNSFTNFGSTLNNANSSNPNLDSNDNKKHGSVMNKNSASPSSSTSANTNSNSNLNTNRRSPNSNQNINSSNDQTNGWRVKLYSLNSDGSWDDCGTGRITCTFNDPISTRTLISGDYTDDSSIYRELGEPTLCMRSELPQQSLNASSSPVNSLSISAPTNNTEIPKILLKTRILLRQVYNRQGDNIITWCEPYFQNMEGADAEMTRTDINGENLANGVDLALSFQDNAGCLDIWRQITNVQSRAAVIRERGINAAFSPSSLITNSNFSSSNSMPNSSTSNYSTLTSNMNTGADTYSDSHQSNTNMINGHSNTQDQNEEEPSANHNIEDTPSSSSTMQLSSEAMEAARHAQIHQQQQHEQACQTHSHHMFSSSNASYNDEHESYPDADNESAAVSMNAVARFQQQNPFDVSSLSCKLPTPNLSNLEEISDIFAASQIQQREALATYLSKNDCAYVKSLLALFPSAEKKDDFNVLATLALSIKTILLLNDHPIIELIVMEEDLFENVCSALEFDPDLRVKANHRWFIRERVKFKTVVKMENENLVSAIHRIFRVSYLRDTLLRPTMDESSLSSLASLLKFTQREVVEGVISPYHDEDEKSNIETKQRKQDSYLMKVLRIIGREMKAIREIEHEALLDSNSNIGGIVEKDRSNQNQSSTLRNGVQNQNSSSSSIDSSTLDIDAISSTPQPSTSGAPSSLWKQHVIPQDSSLSSRKLRRHGCLMFLRELLNMVRGIMQQSEKDYYAMIVYMSIDLKECGKAREDQNQQKIGNNVESFKQDSLSTSQTPECATKESGESQVSLLSLMSAIISDPNAEICDRSAALEILSSIVMHDPTLVRKHCLVEYATITSKLQSDAHYPRKPEPNEHRQVMFRCGSDDLLLSLLYLMAVETDAGLLLQTSEILRIILDTEMLEQGPLVGCVEDETSAISHGGTLEQNKFLALFYEHYVQWLVAPFQYCILISRLSSCFGMKAYETKDLLQHSLKMPKCAIRSNFAVELLCFCVRAHVYRMRFFVLKNCVLRSVLKLMNESTGPGGSFGPGSGGNRCLKLACLRFLRAVLSVKDELYHRHIIQQNLFDIVFQTFRLNPVGDNLVSSAIVEICDFIRNENIKSLLEHIVNDHLLKPSDSSKIVSLEEVSTPYVDTLILLRKRYEENIGSSIERNESKDVNNRNTTMKNGVANQASYFMDNAVGRVGLSGKALEDQRKFRENDEEDSYFNDDDDEKDESSSLQSSSSALGPTHLASIENAEPESDDVRAIQLECKLGLAMVQYSSSSDEDDDDILSGERSNSGNENREGLARSLKRTSLVGIKGGKKPKIQVLMNSKSRVQSNSSQPTNEAQSQSEPASSEDMKSHSNDGVIKSTFTSAIPNVSSDAAHTNI